MKHTYRTIVMISAAIALIAVVLYVLFFVRSAAAPQPGRSRAHTTENLAQKAVSTKRIAVQNYQFTPPVAKLSRGHTMIWSNNDMVPHSIVLDIHGTNVTSSVLNQGANFSYVFDTPGVYTYHDGEHPDESGVVIVTNSDSE